MQSGDSDRAIRELKNLLREFPQLVPARLKLGIIYYNQNNLAEATEQWENVLLRDPKHSEALKYLKMANVAGITTLNY